MAGVSLDCSLKLICSLETLDQGNKWDEGGLFMGIIARHYADNDQLPDAMTQTLWLLLLIRLDRSIDVVARHYTLYDIAIPLHGTMQCNSVITSALN